MFIIQKEAVKLQMNFFDTESDALNYIIKRFSE